MYKGMAKRRKPTIYVIWFTQLDFASSCPNCEVGGGGHLEVKAEGSAIQGHPQLHSSSRATLDT